MDGSTTLGELDEEQRYAVFDDLQQHLPHVWDAMRRDRPEESAVVVPSISLERTTASSGTLMQAMEERALFQLLLLRQPMLTLVYVTSSPIADEIIEYYLGLLPGVVPSQARRRLRLVSVGDASPRPLSEKVLARPRVLRQIRELIPDQSVSHLIPYTTTELERDVAISLGIPMYGADPRLAPLGSKSGCRRLFEEVGVRAPAGAEGLRTVDDLVASVTKMRATGPSPAEVIVKINEGVSGSGNALVDLGGLPAPGDPGEASAVRSRLLELQPEAVGLEVDAFLEAFERLGGVVEERITGTALTSPSVQMRVLPDRTVELLSTHDQLLGGASGQKYLGCVFPADPAYSRLISEPAMAVGQRARRPRCPGAVRRRLRRGPRRRRTTGRRTRSSSTSARAGPPTPSSPCSTSSVGRTTVTRGSTARHRERPSTSWRPTTSRTTGSPRSPRATCSTSWHASGCTSTTRTRPASCSTCSAASPSAGASA